MGRWRVWSALVFCHGALASMTNVDVEVHCSVVRDRTPTADWPQTRLALGRLGTTGCVRARVEGGVCRHLESGTPKGGSGLAAATTRARGDLPASPITSNAAHTQAHPRRGHSQPMVPGCVRIDGSTDPRRPHDNARRTNETPSAARRRATFGCCSRSAPMSVGRSVGHAMHLTPHERELPSQVGFANHTSRRNRPSDAAHRRSRP